MISKKISLVRVITFSLVLSFISCDKEENISIKWEQEQIETEISIGSELYAVVGDTLRVYFYSILQNANNNYIFGLKCDKGRNFTKYWEYIPTKKDIGKHKIDLTIYNKDGLIIDQKEVQLITTEAKNPKAPTNILCLGNSLMSAGQTPIELSRRLKGTEGIYTYPKELNLTNFFLKGRKMNIGKTVGWEGTGGWTWNQYIQTFDVKDYIQQYCNGQLDIVYLQLGINELLFHTPFDDINGIIINAKKFINAFHNAYPQCKVLLGSVLLPSQNGGLGANYPANEVSGIYGERGFNLKVHKLNQAYDSLAHSEEFSSYTYFIDNNAQFDCLHAYPTQEIPAGNYVEGTETIGTNGVHPTDVGYAQIAAGMFRAIICLTQ